MKALYMFLFVSIDEGSYLKTTFMQEKHTHTYTHTHTKKKKMKNRRKSSIENDTSISSKKFAKIIIDFAKDFHTTIC